MWFKEVLTFSELSEKKIMSDKNNDKTMIIIVILVLIILTRVFGIPLTKLVVNLDVFEVELVFSPTATPDLLAPTTPASIPTAISSGISPEQAVRDYYALINQGRYEITWSRLSDHFKDKFNCCNSEGDYDFDEYKRWWSSVARVDIGETRIIEQNGGTATVFAQLSYLMNSGNRITDYKPYIQLVFDPITRTWLFYDKGPTP